MKVENVKKLLPLINAYADGETIQTNFSGEWKDEPILSFDGDPDSYRLKPEPEPEPVSGWIYEFVSIDQGIYIARRIEEFIIPAGYHCALGGSVLHRGESKKDLDIFIYPHNGKKLNPAMLKLKLKLAGLNFDRSFDFSKGYDTKKVEQWTLGPVRIDIFFLQ